MSLSLVRRHCVCITKRGLNKIQKNTFSRCEDLRVSWDGKSLQEYQINVGVSQHFILGPTPFLLYINVNDLPDDVICNIAIYTDDTTSKCDQASDLW